MSDADTAVPEPVEYELVTSSRQLAAPPPLRKKEVVVPDWKTQSGKAAKFLVWELIAADHADFIDSGRTYKNGAVERYDVKDEGFRFLAATVRDQHGNRLWSTNVAAQEQLGKLGRSSLQLLLDAANEVNSERPESAEGNSEGTRSDSSPSI